MSKLNLVRPSLWILKLAILVYVLIPNFSVGQKKIKSLDSLFENYEQSNKFNGAILVADRGNLLYEREFGWANYEANEKLTASTPMPLASITKSFTSASIMILKQNGKLNFDNLVKQYIPLFPYPNITIRHLLTHTAGFKRLENHRAEKNEIFDHRSILNFLIENNPKLSFVAGTEFQYSNTGYAILACVIESISGISYSDFVEQSIFSPLGMANSFVLAKNIEKKARALTYKGSWKVEEKGMSSYIGAIGIYSSAIDLYKFDQALYTNQIIDQNVLAEGFQNGKLRDGSNIKYAFGWRHWKSQQNQMFNRGDWFGVSTILFRDLEKKNTIIILANTDNNLESSEIVDNILNIIERDN